MTVSVKNKRLVLFKTWLMLSHLPLCSLRLYSMMLSSDLPMWRSTSLSWVAFSFSAAYQLWHLKSSLQAANSGSYGSSGSGSEFCIHWTVESLYPQEFNFSESVIRMLVLNCSQFNPNQRIQFQYSQFLKVWAILIKVIVLIFQFSGY